MHRKGFTFVELMIALGIIAYLSITWCWILWEVLSPPWLLLNLSG